MKFGSLFSGIGGFDLGFERAGMSCAWQCEIDVKCQEVLQKHFTGAKLYDDVRTITAGNTESVDLICGGFPCQDVSVAGKRKGLAGDRSGLWFEFHRILSELKPKWVVIENVPGLLSSNRGRDFAVILSGLADIGYMSAWRVLDSQYFGVAQRRRRVFLIASLGNGSAAEVLFESEGVRWHPPARTEAGQGTAGTVEGNTTLGFDLAQITSKLNYSNPKQGDPQPPLNCAAQGFIAYENHPVGQADNNVISQAHGVRRLTPTECARLQGFPDDWNDWLSDSARYKQFGNAVTVNVAEWIGKRIMELENK